MTSIMTSTIVVLGASGLIGESVCSDLLEAGHRVVPVARGFTPAQKRMFDVDPIATPVVDLSEKDLADLLTLAKPDVVVNCIGVLQDDPKAAADVHEGFAVRLTNAMRGIPGRPLLVHLSMPGDAAGDRTDFSRTKRAGESVVRTSGIPYAILRPGFVVAPNAYGGSALVRALAALPFDLPRDLEHRPFREVVVSDISRTVDHLARRRADGIDCSETWDLVGTEAATLGDQIETFRGWLGGPTKRIRLPSWAMKAGSVAGDVVQHLGWKPPIRTTALAELDRGVDGDPRAWMVETGIVPTSWVSTVRNRSATQQERWFARLFLLKPLVFGILAVFWIASGAIAMTVAFDQASGILTAKGMSKGLADAITIVSSSMDITVGIAISFRRTAFRGLVAGVAVSLFYMLGAAVLTPEMWTEPLGALVKTFPAIVLMLVAMAILEERR